MLGLLKKLFGAKDSAPAPAVEEAQAPYKVEVAPVEVATTVEVAPAAAPVTSEVKAEPKKKPAAKKQQFAKKPQAPKPANTTGVKKVGRKPKSKPQA
jgi:monoamine oxidase